MTEFSVIRQEDQPLTVGIKPPDVEEPLFAIPDQIGKAGPSLRIGHRADHAPRLVDRQVGHRGFRRNAPPVDLDDRLPRSAPLALLATEPPVDLDPPLRVEPLARATPPAPP